MKKINESNSVWITSFDREIRRELRGQNACDDVCSTRLIYVLENIDKFMARFPNPKDAVRAMSSNAKNDYWRSESKQRGEGVRRGRKVGQLPSILSFSGQAVAVDIIDHRAIDPELQAIAQNSGLEWVNSDAARIAAVQAAIAAEPKPVHVPRERPAPVVVDEGPLVLVETRKELV